MNKVQIIEKIKMLLKSNQFMSMREKIDSIDESTSLINDLALDSIQIVELIVGIENEFDFTCSYNELSLDMFDRLGELVDFIDNKLKEPKNQNTAG